MRPTHPAAILQTLQLALGLLLWLNIWLNRPERRPRKEPQAWSICSQDFCRLCLIFFTILILLPNIIGKFFPPSDDIWAFVPAFAAQLVLLIFLLHLMARDFFPPSAGLFRRQRWNRELMLRSISHYFLLLPLIFAVSTLWLVLLLYVDRHGLGLSLEPQGLLRAMAESRSPLFLTLAAFMAIFVAPIIEEIFFRCAVYHFLCRSQGPVFAAIVANFCFAIMHWNLPSFLPLFTFGLYLSAVYRRRGTLALPIAIHSLFNANSIALVLLDRLP